MHRAMKLNKVHYVMIGRHHCQDSSMLMCAMTRGEATLTFMGARSPLIVYTVNFYNEHISYNWLIWLWCTHNSQGTWVQYSTFLIFIINISYCAPSKRQVWLRPWQ
ncbi:unnamed protein product [Brassica rapa subsp. trilocularis]